MIITHWTILEELKSGDKWTLECDFCYIFYIRGINIYLEEGSSPPLPLSQIWQIFRDMAKFGGHTLISFLPINTPWSLFKITQDNI